MHLLAFIAISLRQNLKHTNLPKVLKLTIEFLLLLFLLWYSVIPEVILVNYDTFDSYIPSRWRKKKEQIFTIIVVGFRNYF